MNKIIQLSELPLTSDGRVYHLNLLPEELAEKVITVGDPGRVPMVSRYFDKIELIVQHREFVTHTGWVGKKRISVISAGIGTPNVDIVMNELDALMNIDLKTRKINKLTKSLEIVRLGTAGGLCERLNLGDCAVSQYAIGMDGLLNFYCVPFSEEESALKDAFIQHFSPAILPIVPYVAESDPELTQRFSKITSLAGITITCPGFFAPQGRELRGKNFLGNVIDTLASFKYQHVPVVNFEMETSAILGLGKYLGHRCTSLSLIVADRRRMNFSKDILGNMDKLIQEVLWAF